MTTQRIRLLMRPVCFLCILWLALGPAPSVAQDLQKLFDRWNTLRSTLDNRGITLETVNTTDVLGSASGGLRKRASVVGDVDLLLTLDAEKLAGWKGGTFFAYGLGTYGDDPSLDIGDAQTVSSIAAPNTWKLFEAWYQQNLFDERISILAGLYDITSEFNVIRSASELFVNSSFGTNPEYASSGRNGLSTFPNSGLGLRVQAKLANALTLRTVVADGVPADPDDPVGSTIHLKSEDGIVATAELAYRLGRRETAERDEKGIVREKPRRLVFRRLGRAAELEYDAKYALGTWFYTTELDDLNDVDINGRPIRRDGTFGIYGLAEQTIYQEPDDVDQNLIVFLQLGYADPQVNRFSTYVGGGLVHTGLIPGRDRDQTGFGFAIARNGTDFKSAERAAGRPVNNEEVALELTHAAFLTRELVVQPDVQYIINPGTDPSVRNALVIGVRFELHVNWFK